ncbi:hypothetical protein BRC64_03060 [Halobacteriales archaeon QH_10_67_22]|nr:MAG: hypothetical protein BRC64_03060 [Halobacteriales archaeon QH_10_67_22]
MWLPRPHQSDETCDTSTERRQIETAADDGPCQSGSIPVGLTKRTLKVVAVVVLLLALVAGVAFYVLAAPSVGVEDVGDWGEVTDERTEVVTTLWVNNPNALGLTPDGNAAVTYDLTLNRVDLASGETQGLAVPPGNDTLSLSTDIRNERLPAWWVNFVRNDETIPVRAEPTATVTAGPLTASPALPTMNRTLLEDETPVRSSLSAAASETEGRYTRTVSTDALSDQDPVGGVVDESGASEEVTVGYEVRRGWAQWGTVSENTTVVEFHFRVHNPSETVPMPAEPDALGATIAMNDVDLFEATSDDATLQNPENFSTREAVAGRVIEPGETREVVYEVEMDNERVDEWFTSHVRQSERTDVRVEFELVLGAGETTFRLPEDGAAYTCEMQTAMLVDDQETRTTCGEPGSVPGVGTAGPPTDVPGTPTATPTELEAAVTRTATTTVVPPSPTLTPPASTPTEPPEGSAPTTRVTANRTEDEAPLAVSFDGQP